MSHAEMLEFWLANNRQTEGLANFVLQQSHRKLNQIMEESIRKKIKNFVAYVNFHLNKCNRMVTRFKTKHQSWLSSRMQLQLKACNFVDESAKTVGRPRLCYDDGSSRLKRKLAAEVSADNGNNANLLVHAAAVAAKKAHLKNVEEEKKEAKRVPYTPEEALDFLIENSFTKRQYMNIRQHSKNRNCDIYPSYNKVIAAKEKCRPKGICITESVASVPLQNLLKHIVERIMLLQSEVLNIYADISEMKLIASYGFDGSTGQSLYKQNFVLDASDTLDQSLFVTTLIPLKLVDSIGRVIWMNRSPQSVRFCRPLKIEFVKETKTHILKEKANLDLEIQNLLPMVYEDANKQSYTISFELKMTLIDGKVLNILTGTNSTQSCPICGAKPMQFMTITDLESDNFIPKSPQALEYGVSPLHAWIRFFEFVLKIGYRIGINKWQVRGPEDKEKMSARKVEIQGKLWAVLGLHVDKPKANGSGSTNDGNTARKAFLNTDTFASILGFDPEVLRDFYIILITISCNFEIDVQKFKNFCKKAGSLYMEKYPWYPMSATVHKVLAHGAQIIAASSLPLGCLAENASEARNKFYKKDRRSHARQNSRINTMTDVFCRALDSSDPLVSSIYIQQRLLQNKKHTYPAEVLELLRAPNVNFLFNNVNADDDDKEDDLDTSECIDIYSFDLDVEND